MSEQRIEVLALMGPTATGKTDCAVGLVRRWPFEIISVDSAMVYRGMDIGSAKPGPEVLAIAPHRMIDILDPSEEFTPCLLYTSPSPRDRTRSRMPSSA